MPRAAKFLPPKATPRILQYLEKYLEDKPHRGVACAALFQCSRRVADRLTSRKTPFKGKIRRFWASRLAAELRIPVARLLGSDWVPYPNALVGWTNLEKGADAMEMAMKVGEAILHQAFSGFDLSGRVTISHYSGIPQRVVAALTLDPAMANVSPEHNYSRIVVEAVPAEDGRKKMWYWLYDPTGFCRCDYPLTTHWLEEAFLEIHGFSKNYAAQLVREST